MTKDGQDVLHAQTELAQLRAALRSAEEENARLSRERRVLSSRLEQQAREYREANEGHRRIIAALVEGGGSGEAAGLIQAQTEEDLRVAIEELQVLSEELEASNQTLRQVNHDLDDRVAARTRDLERANRDLRASENALRAVTDLIPDLLWRATRHGDVVWCNKRWHDYTGQTEAVAVGHGWLGAVHVEDRGVTRIAWQRAVADGASFEREVRLRDPGGQHRWFLLRAAPTLDADGISGWYAALTDIHARRLTMQALTESEQLFRSLIEGIPQLVWRSRSRGAWVWCSPQWSHFTGQAPDAALGLGWVKKLHPADQQAALSAWIDAESLGALDLEARIYDQAGARYRHFRIRASPVAAEDRRAMEWLGTCTDVDDLLELQGRQQVLVAELQHRTRNLLAVVQSLVRRTAAGSGSLEDFLDRIGERLDALARVQSLLGQRSEGTRVTVADIVRAELAAHVEFGAEGPDGRVSVEGPEDVGLRAANVQTFALALHELATNAIKYGALAYPEGRLAVCWRLQSENDERRLVLEWRESNVPVVPAEGAPSIGGGYGRQLIERALPYQLRARTSYRFTRDGLHCLIDVPLPQAGAEALPG